jgi:hypothetical protein
VCPDVVGGARIGVVQARFQHGWIVSQGNIESIIFPMDRIAAFDSIATQVSQGVITFPPNVLALRKLQQGLSDPECHIDLATKLVLTDPMLAARTVALANSVAFNRNSNDISNVRSAIQRIGMRTLQSLLTALMVRQLSSAITNPVVKRMAAQLWEHTAHVAALSQVLARRVSKVDPDTAMFAGIVHEVGGFYMLTQAGAFPGILEGEPEDWIEHGEMVIGRGVLAMLVTPAPVLAAVEALWHGFRALPPETLGDTLLLANDLAPVASPLHQRPGATTMQAARTIDFIVGSGTLKSVMEESADEVKSLLGVLML